MSLWAKISQPFRNLMLRLRSFNLSIINLGARNYGIDPKDCAVEFIYEPELMSIAVDISGRRFNVSSEDDLTPLESFIKNIPIVERQLILNLLAQSAISLSITEPHLFNRHHPFMEDVANIVIANIPEEAVG
ncbi:hypothetical protein HGB13_01650 [bacterium]|nr:hypothetical protein [bacterium]